MPTQKRNSRPAGIARRDVAAHINGSALDAGIDMGGAAGDPNFMTSLARGLAVIRGFSHEQGRATIAQLSRHTGIPRAAVRRCLYTLERLGYVSSEDGAYALQPKLLTLGHAYLSSTPLLNTVQPFLDRISEAVHESASLAILQGDDILYLARSLASRILSVNLTIGSRLPAYCTSIGYVLLANLEPQRLEAYLAGVHLQRHTEYTVASPAKLREVLKAVREQGYAIAEQQMELGVRSIAVPVRDSEGTVVAGINVVLQASRMPLRAMKKAFLPTLLEAAQALSAQLVPEAPGRRSPMAGADYPAERRRGTRGKQTSA